MDVKWDPGKDGVNLKKHGVSFSDAEIALWDPDALTFEDSDSKGEQRFVTIGTDTMGRILVLVYSHDGEDIRLISARKASSGERKQYEN